MVDNDIKTELIDKILEKEHKMFLAVPADGEYSCQSDSKGFRLHRSSQFITWSEQTLLSYLEDLEAAEAEGLNLMTLKYARMDKLIPPVSTNPLIEKIAEIQIKRQNEMFNTYPKFMSRARPISRSEDSSAGTSFETYTKSELETYSDITLTLLYGDILAKERAGINISTESYDYLVRSMGYSSLSEAEKSL